MSQEDILKLLEKKNRPLTSSEISKLLNDCQTKINHLLNKLIKHSEISFKEISREKARKITKNKELDRRIRIYFLIKD